MKCACEVNGNPTSLMCLLCAGTLRLNTLATAGLVEVSVQRNCRRSVVKMSPFHFAFAFWAMRDIYFCQREPSSVSGIVYANRPGQGWFVRFGPKQLRPARGVIKAHQCFLALQTLLSCQTQVSSETSRLPFQSHKGRRRIPCLLHTVRQKPRDSRRKS